MAVANCNFIIFFLITNAVLTKSTSETERELADFNLPIRLCSDRFCDLFECVPLGECEGKIVKDGSVCGCCDACVKILDRFCDLFECVPLGECEGKIVKDGSVCGCCDACVKILVLGDKCFDIGTWSGIPSGIVTTSKCGPGLKCSTNNICVNIDEKGKKCHWDKLNRERAVKKFQAENPLNTIFQIQKPLWMPDCNAEGYYKPKQCKDNAEKCFCVDPNGGRLFGEAEKELATNMTCRCSLAMYHKKINLGAKWMTSLQERCDAMGNYNVLQCVDDICFCVEPQTGEMLGSPVKAHEKIFLPCYSYKDSWDDSYLSPCEEQVHRERSLSLQFARKGIEIIRSESITCDLDGTYSSFQCNSQICRCTDRKGLPYSSYATDITTRDPGTIDCRCARNEMDNLRLGAQYSQMKCAAEGSFTGNQCFGTRCFCVDKDGEIVAQVDGTYANKKDMFKDCEAIASLLEIPT